ALEEDSRPAAEGLWRRGVLIAVVFYAVASAAAILMAARPEEAFRFSPRIGFHDREVGPGGAFRWTRRHFALWLRPGHVVRLGLAHFTPEPGPVAIEAESNGRTI